MNGNGLVLSRELERWTPTRIPSRNATVRRDVRKLYAECSWLSPADLQAVVRYADLCRRFARISERLDAEGETLQATGEPRRLLDTLRAINDSLLRLEQALGLTPLHRSALGLNLLEGAAMARAMDVEIDQEIDALLSGPSRPQIEEIDVNEKESEGES